MTTESLKLFYFSRKGEPPHTTKYLVSGVVQALSMEDARRALADALLKAKNPDSAGAFVFSDIHEAGRNLPIPAVCAITMANGE